MAVRKTLITLEQARADLTGKLKFAGAGGLRKAKVVSGKPSSDRYRVCRQALQDLEQAGEVLNIDTVKRPLYVLAAFAPTLESVSDKISAHAAKDGGLIFTLKDFEKVCLASERAFLPEALKWLLAERRLVRVRRRQSVFYLSPEAIVPVPAEPPPLQTDKQVSAGYEQAVVQAYRLIVSRENWKDVRISDLQRESGVPLDDLKILVLEKCRCGQATVSSGDWSLADEEYKKAALYIDDRPYLRVRFIDEGNA